LLRTAVAAVEKELRLRGLEPSWALATLAPVLARFSFRIRQELGMPSGMEVHSMKVMAAAERLLDL
jgi:hypothetical protein